uniref:CSC1/OSCA1-like cytosolic domain-containing protein n=1 Tax=Alexandrium monilatum TaxID=311494 RepID=A0A7S4T2U1_9DINO
MIASRCALPGQALLLVLISAFLPHLASAARPASAHRHTGHKSRTRRSQRPDRRPAGVLLAVRALESTNTSAPACLRKQQGHPSEIQCPEACPFLRAEPTEMCAFTCVAEGQCHADDPLASFANPETMRCEGCKAVACAQCKTSWKCAKCQEGFVLSRFDTCISPYRGIWWLAYAFILLVVFPVVYYIVMLPFRPVVNKAVLEKGMDFREVCKLLEPSTGLPYRLWRNLGDHYLAGIGVMLHFRWQQLVIAWSLLVCLTLLVVSCFFKTRPAAIKHEPGSPKAFASCEHGIVQQEHEFVVMEKTYFFVVLAIYIISTVGSLAFAIFQRRCANRTADEVISMGDYAVYATGFPIWEGTVKCEEEVKAFFQKCYPDLDIVGASLCWDLYDKKTREWVEEENQKDLWDLDCQLDAQSGDEARRTSRGELLAQDAKWKNTRLECLDVIWGIGPGVTSEEKSEETPEEEVEAKLKLMKTTGAAFIVLGTERQCQEALKRARQSPLLFDEKHPITIAETGVEPETVAWSGFGTSLLVFVLNLILGNIAIFACVIILDIFFYAPYVVYIFMYSDVKGMVGGGLIQGTLLGLLITVCNQIIFQVIGVIAEKCGFKFMPAKRKFYMVQYTVAVFFNTCVDLWTVMLLAQGFSVQEVASKMQDPVHAMGDGGVLSPKAIAEHPAVQRSVYVQLLTYLFPGCLLIPFLLEPVVAGFVSYLLPTWLVRSRPEVDVQEAERRLAAPDFDLSRYGDILVNVMLCVLTLAFTYRDLYQVFAWLTVSLVIIYCWDHYRFLRCSNRAVFSSAATEITAQWLIAVPCGILAGVLVFHIWAASDNGFLEPMADLWNHTLKQILLDDLTRSYLRLARTTIVWYMLAAFAGHLLFHFAILFWLVPEYSGVHAEHDDTVPYATTAAVSPSTWFNANPVHTLRSKHIFKHDPPCIAYLVGKAYLQKPNPQIGQHYECLTTPKMLRANTSGGSV